jgi:selenocysteine-specific elongation factor
MAQPPSLVIGTAGHIDHGKSALVKALTGTDPDRLKEEQERGITIDLGFAHATMGGVQVAFVDVPGHERFVRNMLAGAGGMDAVLLVVAADESVMPQTREHFEICRLLGIERGLIVLSKADVADPEMLDLAALETRELVAGSFLASAPILPVSARTGAGLDALRAAIAALAGTTVHRGRAGVARLPVDRVFTMKGFGTVITGTLVSGRVAEGDELAALPEGRRVRVRGVQVHGRQVAGTDAPRRVALNLGGVDVGELSRGVTLATPGSIAVTRRFDARLELIPGARPLRHGARLRVHHGTSETIGRVAVCASRATPDAAWRQAQVGEALVAVPAGGEAYVRIRLDRPAVLTRNDRVVLRAYSPPATIGGATVLDPGPTVAGLRRADVLRRFEEMDAPAAGAADGQLSRWAGVWLRDAAGRGLDTCDLVARGGVSPEAASKGLAAFADEGRAVVVAGRAFDADALRGLQARVLTEITAHHRTHPRDEGMPREAARERAAGKAAPVLFDAAVAALVEAGALTGRERLALAARAPATSPGERRAYETIETLLRTAGLAPPDLPTIGAAAGLAPADLEHALRTLTRERRLARLGTLHFHVDALETLKAEVRALGAARPAGAPATVDVSTFKERYGLSRKFAIPLLEWLDRERITRRVGAGRIVL